MVALLKTLQDEKARANHLESLLAFYEQRSRSGKEPGDPNGVKSAGSYVIPFNASQLSSGIYLYRLKAGNTLITNRMTLIK